MEHILQFMITASGNPELGRWLAIGLFGLAVFSLVLAVLFLLFGLYDPVRQRLQSVTGSKDESGSVYRDTTEYLGGFFVIRDKADEKLSYDRRRLIYAGYQKRNSLAHYYGVKIMLMTLLPFLGFFSYSTFFPDISINILLLTVIASLLAGFIMPSFYLDQKVEKRQRSLRNSFPDAVDQLIVCTEAGLGIDAGLQRVANDIILTNEILGLVNAELRAGVRREQALKNLVTRTGVEEIRGLVAALSQSMRFGISIGNTLRIYAEDMRDKRMQKAEEEAAKLAVKMLFPLAFCFFPGILIVILGPAVISIHAAFH